ncbi:hypothetical protein [Peterkaempfera bronchialis]|uniref:hypothetical protein n=1 Tax=Peterkaempfera bronchialis TaxID=2126346 RepID=UPI0013B3A8CE|nr:hypothetical protein [Peterkaempfera bronchialis]
MAGAKPRKDDKDDKDDKAKASRESRLQGERQPQAERFGSAVRADLWLVHLDVRAAGNGLLLTVSPAEVGYPAMARQLRLRNGGVLTLRELAAAFRAGTEYRWGVGDRRFAKFRTEPWCYAADPVVEQPVARCCCGPVPVPPGGRRAVGPGPSRTVQRCA